MYNCEQWLQAADQFRLHERYCKDKKVCLLCTRQCLARLHSFAMLVIPSWLPIFWSLGKELLSKMVLLVKMEAAKSNDLLSCFGPLSSYEDDEGNPDYWYWLWNLVIIECCIFFSVMRHHYQSEYLPDSLISLIFKHVQKQYETNSAKRGGYQDNVRAEELLSTNIDGWSPCQPTFNW